MIYGESLQNFRPLEVLNNESRILKIEKISPENLELLVLQRNYDQHLTPLEADYQRRLDELVFRGYIQHRIIEPDASFDEFSQKDSLFPGKTTRGYALISRETNQPVATVSKNNFADFFQQSPLHKDVVVEACKDNRQADYLKSIPSDRIWEVSGLTNEAGQSKLLSIEMLRSIFSEAYHNGNQEIFSGLLFAPTFDTLQYIYSRDNMVRIGKDITVQDYFGNKDFPSKARLVPFYVEIDSFIDNIINSIQDLSLRITGEYQCGDSIDLVNDLLKPNYNADENKQAEYKQLQTQARFLFFMSEFVRDRIPESQNKIIDSWTNL